MKTASLDFSFEFLTDILLRGLDAKLESAEMVDGAIRINVSGPALPAYCEGGERLHVGLRMVKGSGPVNLRAEFIELPDDQR